MITVTLARNIVIEANAATSRIKSVISVSCLSYVFILFFLCSHVNPNRSVAESMDRATICASRTDPGAA